MRTLRVGLAQIDTTVGDLAGNAAKIIEWIGRARDLGVDVVAFPELAVTGYPPEDLVLRRSFVEDNLEALEMIVAATQGIAAVVGFVDVNDDIFNAAAVISDGRLAGRYHKQFLPNYGVFDEERYFRRGSASPVYVIAGIDVGVNICEDIWYPDGPTRDQARAGAEVIININASPYHRAKGAFRETMIATRANDNSVVVCHVNAVGGQDELVFDGHSLICDERGVLVARGAQFREDLLVYDIDVEGVMQTRLHDPRTRKERRSPCAADASAPTVVSEAPFGAAKPAISPSMPELLDPVAEVWGSACAGRARLHWQDGIRNRADCAVRRDRLVDRRGDRGRGTGAGARRRRIDAVALLVGRQQDRRAGPGRAAGDPIDNDTHRAGVRCDARDAVRSVC